MMKKNTIMAAATLCIMTCALTISCTTDNEAIEQTAGSILTVAVTDNGFANPDGTRTQESDYTTTFTSGDKIGVFAVRNGELDTRVSNVCMTYDGSSWTGTLYYVPNATYYAYYPYTDGTTIDASATDVFTTLVSNWQVQSDQSSYANYTSSDLMTSSAATVSGSSISFSMTHKMGLVVIEMPKVSYTVDEGIVSVPASVSWKSPTSFSPYIIDATNGIARYITNSSQAISGSYGDGKYLFSFTTSIERGQYKTYSINDGGSYTGTVVNISSDTPTDPIADNTLITGTSTSTTAINIADGANVVLYGLTTSGRLTCKGNATIYIEGTNVTNDGIEAGGEGTTLTIDGNGTLTAKINGECRACIGGSRNSKNGDIVINGSILNLEASKYSAAIGCGQYSSCGNITINGGTITATGGESGAGIGSGNNNAKCGKITINGGTVVANGGYIAINTSDPNSEYSGLSGAGIGSGDYNSSCGGIEITGGYIKSTGGPRGAGIGSGSRNSTCDNIIICGGTITAIGGQYAVGIGSGNQGNNTAWVTYSSTCGTITITSDVEKVTVTKGSDASEYIGKSGNSGTCGTITIAEGAKSKIFKEDGTTLLYTE